VTNKTAGSRYARALFEVASAEKGNLQQIGSQLADFVALLKEHPPLEKVLLNPAVPAPRKRAAVAELLRDASFNPVLAKTLLLLTERDRLVVLPDLLAAFRDRLLAQQNIIQAEVTSAAPLSPERTRAIEQSLATATGRNVSMTTRVDPSIVGGLVARLGSTIYDASVTRQLERMKKTLQEGTGG
jgi:F-type H+-transporting ATPase subunit delta